MTVPALVYARVSTEEQGKGFSLPTQLEACRRYCAERGYLVTGEYTDDVSGTLLERPGFVDLVAHARRLRDGGQAPVVVVYDLDRLGRGSAVVAILEYQLEHTGARVEYVLAGEQYTGPEGALLKAIKAALSGYENLQRAERSRRGMRGRVQAGFPVAVAGVAPYGYRYEGGRRFGRLVPDPVEAEVVRAIFRWLVDERLSARQIALRLSAMAVPTRGDGFPGRAIRKRAAFGTWRVGVVTRIVKNPLYRGEYRYGMTRRVMQPSGKASKAPQPPELWVRAAVPALVDEATWQAAQERLRENLLASPRNVRRHYLLRGRVFCPAPCGRRWVGAASRGVRYYLCPAVLPEARTDPLPAEHPPAPRLNARRLEAAVWALMCAELVDRERILARVRALREERLAAATRLEDLLQAAGRRRADVDRRLSALLSRELDGYPAEVVAAHRQELLRQRRELLAEMERLQAERDRLLDTVERLPRHLDDLAVELASEEARTLWSLGPAERRRLIEDLDVRVTVLGRDEVVVRGLFGERRVPVDTPAARAVLKRFAAEDGVPVRFPREPRHASRPSRPEP